MVHCVSDQLVWQLSRRSRQVIFWDVDGLPLDADASIQLEGTGPWRPLVINTERDLLSTWAAGPDFPDPGDALLVPATSHVEIRVVAGMTTVFLDGGFIKLIP